MRSSPAKRTKSMRPATCLQRLPAYPIPTRSPSAIGRGRAGSTSGGPPRGHGGELGGGGGEARGGAGGGGPGGSGGKPPPGGGRGGSQQAVRTPRRRFQTKKPAR